MRIRRAQEADASAIADIWNHEIREGVSTFTTEEKTVEDVVRLVDGRDAFFVAEAKVVIGFATYGPFRGGPGYAQTVETTVYLTPGAQRAGTGRGLMQALEDDARSTGVHVMVAGIGHENAAGLAFHERLGFAEVARMPEVGRKFGRWMDLVLTQKIL